MVEMLGSGINLEKITSQHSPRSLSGLKYLILTPFIAACGNITGDSPGWHYDEEQIYNTPTGVGVLHENWWIESGKYKMIMIENANGYDSKSGEKVTYVYRLNFNPQNASEAIEAIAAEDPRVKLIKVKVRGADGNTEVFDDPDDASQYNTFQYRMLTGARLAADKAPKVINTDLR